MSKALDNRLADNTLAYNNLITFAHEQMGFARVNPRGESNRPFNALLAFQYWIQARDVAYRSFMDIPAGDARLAGWESEYRACQTIVSRMETHFALMLASAHMVTGDEFIRPTSELFDGVEVFQ